MSRFDDFMPALKLFGLHPNLNNCTSVIKSTFWIFYFGFIIVSIMISLAISTNYKEVIQSIESAASAIQVMKSMRIGNLTIIKL